LARKFLHSTGLGFVPGRRNRVTVLDIDSSDPAVLAQAQIHHGESPILVRTASGKYHQWHRWSGETGRFIRPWGPHLPIDILAGRLVVAPPSQTQNGIYEFVRGGLDDLDRLPVLRGLDDRFYQNRNSGAVDPAGYGWEPAYSPVSETSSSDWSRMRRGDGRNNALFRQLAREAHGCDNLEDLLRRALELNSEFAEPMTEDRVMSTVQSVWKMTQEGRNRFGRHGAYLPTASVDEHVGEPYLLTLISWLKAHNGPNAEFLVADGLEDGLRWLKRAPRIGQLGRLFVDLIVWIARTGAPWRDISPVFPAGYSPRAECFRRRGRSGHPPRVHGAPGRDHPQMPQGDPGAGVTADTPYWTQVSSLTKSKTKMPAS